MKYKEESCPWRLYARPKESSTTWSIIINKTPYNYRRPSGDRKHLQFISNLIADCIR
jgi:hypothetical protein